MLKLKLILNVNNLLNTMVHICDAVQAWSGALRTHLLYCNSVSIHIYVYYIVHIAVYIIFSDQTYLCRCDSILLCFWLFWLRTIFFEALLGLFLTFCR